MIKSELNIIDDRTFKISVKVKDGTLKEFVFKTLREGHLGTWITFINLNISNPTIDFSSETKL